MMSTPAGSSLDKANIQAPVVSAYSLARSRHFLLRVEDAAAARAFVGSLHSRAWIASVAGNDTNKGPLPRWRLNIAFTYEGLRALQLAEKFLRVFADRAPAFMEGAYPRAARRLADTGDSAVDTWEPDFKGSNAHILLTLHADEMGVLEEKSADLKSLAGDGLVGWEKSHDGAHLANSEDGLSFDPRRPRTVHFGFIDGISKISIAGLTDRRSPDANRKEFAAGEFLLGEVNEAKVNAWVLPTAAPEVRSFFKSGTFAVLRKMKQEEIAFREFLDRESERLSVDRGYVMAKLLGRWQDGRVVTAGSSENSPAPADLDDFTFADDRVGRGCPLGSHIRRMNPRDDPVVPFGARPLIRRGMPYGPPYDPDRSAERGLLGLFLCASLEDQFEHLVSEWGDRNPMGTGNRGTAKDPLFGNHAAPAGALDIPMADGSQRDLRGFKSFVKTRGTVYAFMPSLSALSVIAGADAESGGRKGRNSPPGPAIEEPEPCPICKLPLNEHV